MLAGSSVKALRPQCTEIAFVSLTVAVCVLLSFFDSLFGSSDLLTTGAVIAFGFFENFFMFGMGGYTAFYTSHDLSPDKIAVYLMP